MDIFCWALLLFLLFDLYDPIRLEELLSLFKLAVGWTRKLVCGWRSVDLSYSSPGRLNSLGFVHRWAVFTSDVGSTSHHMSKSIMPNWRRWLNLWEVCSCYWSSLTDKLLNCCTNHPPACTWTHSRTTDCRPSRAATINGKLTEHPESQNCCTAAFFKMKYSCWAAGRPVCLSPAPTGVCSGTRRQVKLSELSAAAVLIFSFKVDSCFNDSCCSCCLSRCQTVSLSLHVYEAKNMTQIKNKIRNKTNPSAVGCMCTLQSCCQCRLDSVPFVFWAELNVYNTTEPGSTARSLILHVETSDWLVMNLSHLTVFSYCLRPQTLRLLSIL